MPSSSIVGRFSLRRPFASFFSAALLGAAVLGAGFAHAFEPITIVDQQSFAAGGTSAANPGTFDALKPTAAGQSIHGDHAYFFCQKPQNAKANTMVFLHGAMQFSKTWETTPDGREGFQTIFLRTGFPTCVIDQPRRGNAGRSMVDAVVKADKNDQTLFGMFRLGLWPNFYENAAFSRDPAVLEQFFRQVTPNIGDFDAQVAAAGIVAGLEKTGPTVLVTHSQGGGVGWLVGMKSANVRGIAAYEPGSGFVFPQGEAPATMPSSFGPLAPEEVPLEDFMALTKFPIVVYYGDNIPEKPSSIPNADQWRVRVDMAKLWVAAVNRHGGNASLVKLPDLGIRGNTHFPFSDLNNLDVARVFSDWLHEQGLDR